MSNGPLHNQTSKVLQKRFKLLIQSPINPEQILHLTLETEEAHSMDNFVPKMMNQKKMKTFQQSSGLLHNQTLMGNQKKLISLTQWLINHGPTILHNKEIKELLSLYLKDLMTIQIIGKTIQQSSGIHNQTLRNH